jgi:hypothetical protein
MSYIPATSDRDLYALLGALVGAGLGLAWFDRMRARRRDIAATGAPGTLPATGQEPGAVPGGDRTEAGQDPESPR